MPHRPSAGFSPRHTCSRTTPKLVRNCSSSRLRCCAFRPPRGKNRALLFDLRLELLLEPSAHPFAAFGFHFQFQFPQGITSAGVRVHALPLVIGCYLSDEEPTFPAIIMVRVSSCAPEELGRSSRPVVRIRGLSPRRADELLRVLWRNRSRRAREPDAVDGNCRRPSASDGGASYLALPKKDFDSSEVCLTLSWPRMECQPM